MTKPDELSNVTPLFQGAMRPSRHATECEFLTRPELDFLRRVWNRTDRVLSAPGAAAAPVAKNTLKELGYTEETHAHFIEGLRRPAIMDQDELISILRPLRHFYLVRLEEELRELTRRAEALDKLEEIPVLTKDADGATALDEHKRTLSNEFYGAHETVSSLNDVVHGLSYLIGRKVRDNVVSLDSHRAARGAREARNE
jgi:hypothetical protein